MSTKVTNPKFADYGAEMGTGFLVNQTVLGADWHRGTPRSATIVGLNTTAYKIDRTQLLSTKSFCCTKCGMLKSYADESDPPDRW